MIASDDSQLIHLSFETSSAGMPLSSFSRNIKEQFGTFFQVGETYPELHTYHTLKHIYLTIQEKADNVMI